jgi:cytochrome c5
MTRRSLEHGARDEGRTAVGVVLLSLAMLCGLNVSSLDRLVEPRLSAQQPGAQPVKSSLTTAVFTEQQAERGREAYERACTYCHRGDLSGNEDGAPALRGSGFLERWGSRPLADLSLVIKETMPQDDPKSLTASECAAIVAYILKRNGASAGQRELPPA